MNNDRDLIKQQRQKWLAERSLEQKLNEAGIDKKMIENSASSNILSEITLKLSEKIQSEFSQYQSKDKKLRNHDIQMEKTISKEIETNTCPICYELMVPPKNSPILLFPCGHTFCKVCVYMQNNKQIQKCPCCRAVIKSSALNISLQNLICVFTNNKHLIDKYQVESEQEEKKEEINTNLETYRNNLNLCKIRCKILRDEINELKSRNFLLDENVVSQQNFLNKLYMEKKEVGDKIEKLKKEFGLINDFINKNEKDLKDCENEYEENKNKIKLIQETLLPVENEKEKYEILIRNFN